MKELLLTPHSLKEGKIAYTSEEEIKEGDWQIDPIDKEITRYSKRGMTIGRRQSKIVATSGFTLEGVRRIEEEAEFHTFEVKEKGWAYFYNDENELNQHSEIFPTKQKCLLAYKILKAASAGYSEKQVRDAIDMARKQTLKGDYLPTEIIASLNQPKQIKVMQEGDEIKWETLKFV